MKKNKLLIGLLTILVFSITGLLFYCYNISEQSSVKQNVDLSQESKTSESNQAIQRILYLKSLTDDPQDAGEITIMDTADNSKNTIQKVSTYVGPMDSHDISTDGKLIYTTSIEKSKNIFEYSLWVSDKATAPKKILTIENRYIESPKITTDGTKIAYSLINYSSASQTAQLWTINSDGSNNELLIDKTENYIEESGPFRFISTAWSADKTKIYLTTTTDSDATPTGLYVADILKKTIEKAKTPQETLWELSFSPDRSKIAYKTFQWKEMPDSFPERTAPFTINITEIKTGRTEKILESNNNMFSNPIWSSDGQKIAYTISETYQNKDLALYTIDINSRKTKKILDIQENARIKPWFWLANSIVYTYEKYSSGEISNKITTYLFSINPEDNSKKKIDQANEISVFGILN